MIWISGAFRLSGQVVYCIHVCVRSWQSAHRIVFQQELFLCVSHEPSRDQSPPFFIFCWLHHFTINRGPSFGCHSPLILLLFSLFIYINVVKKNKYMKKTRERERDPLDFFFFLFPLWMAKCCIYIHTISSFINIAFLLSLLKFVWDQWIVLEEEGPPEGKKKKKSRSWAFEKQHPKRKHDLSQSLLVFFFFENCRRRPGWGLVMIV